MRSVRFHSIHRGIRSSQLALIKLVEYGLLMWAMNYKLCLDMKMKYSHVHLIMKGTLSLLGLKIIHAEYGKIKMHLSRQKKELLRISEMSEILHIIIIIIIRVK